MQTKYMIFQKPDLKSIVHEKNHFDFSLPSKNSLIPENFTIIVPENNKY
jgi:hypothetical protein